MADAGLIAGHNPAVLAVGYSNKLKANILETIAPPWKSVSKRLSSRALTVKQLTRSPTDSPHVVIS